MNEQDKIREAARLLGSIGGRKPKTITDQDRANRRERARGLASLRQQRQNNEILELLNTEMKKGTK